MAEHPHEFRNLMDKLSGRMIDFLQQELDIETISVTFFLQTIQKMDLNYLTSMINVEGNIKMLFAFSYDDDFFNEIFNRYTEELEIDAEEKEEAYIDSAGDIINIIVGNTLADLKDTEKIIISPPIVITEAKQIGRPRKAVFYTAKLVTKYGKLDIYLVGPNEQFDLKLNYLGNNE